MHRMDRIRTGDSFRVEGGVMCTYRNRRARGQCVSCKKQAAPQASRCQECQEKHREKQRQNSVETNARRRERAYQRSLNRERRLDEIDKRLQHEVAELEKAWAAQIAAAKVGI
jgi:hypothetical protein